MQIWGQFDDFLNAHMLWSATSLLGNSSIAIFTFMCVKMSEQNDMIAVLRGIIKNFLKGWK